MRSLTVTSRVSCAPTTPGHLKPNDTFAMHKATNIVCFSRVASSLAAASLITSSATENRIPAQLNSPSLPRYDRPGLTFKPALKSSSKYNLFYSAVQMFFASLANTNNPCVGCTNSMLHLCRQSARIWYDAVNRSELSKSRIGSCGNESRAERYTDEMVFI